MKAKTKKDKIIRKLGIEKAKLERGKTYIVYIQNLIVLMGSLKILGLNKTGMIIGSFGLIILTWLVGSIDYKSKLVSYETGYVTQNNKYIKEFLQEIKEITKNEGNNKNHKKRNKNKN